MPAVPVRFERNLGILTAAEQARLAGCRVVLLGLGGLGGVIAEVLARAGVSALVLIDHDCFEESNLNRQVFAFAETLGRPKTEVTREFLARINPDLRLQLADTITEANVAGLLDGADAVVLAADDLVPCLIAARRARALGIPVVEGYALPYANVRVFLPDGPTFEDCYRCTDLPDPLGALSAERRAALTAEMILSVRDIDGLLGHFTPDVMERVRARRIPSFAPMVWFCAVRMALETLKLLLGKGTPAAAPGFALYDPFLDRIPSQHLPLDPP